jgi:hypothetical protein
MCGVIHTRVSQVVCIIDRRILRQSPKSEAFLL